MIYLRNFTLPSRRKVDMFFDPWYKDENGHSHAGDSKIHRTVYDNSYPFRVFYDRNMPSFTFCPVTILYGGNGSGKSTILNIMAKKLGFDRASAYNKSPFFDDYAKLCTLDAGEIPEGSRMITSDDVFNYLQEIRNINGKLEAEREALYNEYMNEKQAAKRGERVQMRSLDDYEALKRRIDVTHRTQSSYVKERVPYDVRGESNGESAYRYFTQAIHDDALYLLDEPENSMAPKLQLELKEFLENSCRFFGCQFVIATHSPFLLAMKGAAVYDLDMESPTEKHWTELENVQTYYRFFMENRSAFGD